jgi:hypothetical protein
MYSEPLRCSSPHHQRVRVVESELTCDAGAVASQFGRDALQRQALSGVEDFFGDCAGVWPSL